MIRLLKPLEHYERKYGTKHYALEKLYLMMEKQHNRGQEGAGVACVKLHPHPGHEYMYREKAEGKDAITKVFKALAPLLSPLQGENQTDLNSSPEGGGWEGASLFMGHLRYSTTSMSGLKYVHPFLRRNNWRAKNLCLCGNFNMTNIEEVFQFLTAQGQYPRVYSDTYVTLELMGHRLDREAERNFVIAKEKGLEGTEITDFIDTHIDMANVLKTTMPHFDGGYVMCGMTGSGEMFSMRDPWGIRPAFYYADDEIVAIASERPVLQTTFDIDSSDIQELTPGQALIVNYAGEMRLEQIIEPISPSLITGGVRGGSSACSFEHIYFSRGNDEKIHQERKQLGAQVCDDILKAIDNDIDNTVFSFIPNTAEVAYYGMVEEMSRRAEALATKTKTKTKTVRAEKVVWKDIKLRTFITEGSSRKDLAAHVYDVTFGIVRPGVDNLVVIDDSIVRGTTLQESIINILARLKPKKIVIVSSAPQIRYPDFYGIDMSNVDEFIAFQACIALLRERGMHSLITDCYNSCKEMVAKHKTEILNPLRLLYEPFTVEELNKKMAELLTPKLPPFMGRAGGEAIPVELVFQSLDGLHRAIPDNPGDWYFSGHYPTPGGNLSLCKAYINWYEKEGSNIF